MNRNETSRSRLKHPRPWLLISISATWIGCTVRAPSEEHYRVDKRSSQGLGSSYDFDLDGDGVNDTTLDVRPCTSDPQHYCLNVDSAILTPRQIPLGPGSFPLGSPPCDIGAQFRPVVMGVPIQTIGDYTGDNLSEVSLLYTRRNSNYLTPALAIFDVVAQQLLNATTAPPGLARFRDYNLASWTDYPRDPSGRLHPFLAPGYGDELIGSPPRAAWGYLCVFQPESGRRGNCGLGFAETSTLPSVTEPEWLHDYGDTYYFREVGGNLHDLDNDGWEDIHVISHGSIVSISSRTADPMVTTTFNVSGPGTGYVRHAGRLYGVHTAVTSSDGKLRNIILGGDPVDVLNDPLCNVSRFVTVLESNPGQPDTRHMAWTNYFGYYWDSVYPDGGFRPGQFADGCVTRFSDGRSNLDGEEVVVVNYFHQLPDGGSPDPLKSRGDWSTRVFQENDGSILFDNGRAYVWGWSDRIHPSGETIYLTEATAPDVSFDMSDVPRTPLSMRRLRDGSWDTSLGDSPVIGRPKIIYPPWGGMVGPRGEGSFTAYAELFLNDVDGDGLQDVLLEDYGTWIGWSRVSEAWEIKGYSLIIDLTGPGANLSSVSSLPAGLTCAGSRCSGSFIPGTELSLQSEPASGYRFVNFTGDPGCSDATMVMNAPRRCTANFAAASSVFMQQVERSEFGSGADGTLTVSTPMNINTQSLGSSSDQNGDYADGIAYQVLSDPTGQTSITTTVAAPGIVPGDKILLIDLGVAPGSSISSVGFYDLLDVIAVSGNVITVSTAPSNRYTGGGFATQKVVVQRVPQYSELAINNGGVIATGAWDGLATQPIGFAGVNTGIVAFAVQGALTIDVGGLINVNQRGYRGAISESGIRLNGRQGEGLCGNGGISTAESCGGGGGGTTDSPLADYYGAEGGGGGHWNPGEDGSRDRRDTCGRTTPGSGGAHYGPPNLSQQVFLGSGGGAGGNYDDALIQPTARGGDGGGIVFILASSFNNQGVIQSDGQNGQSADNALSGGAGAGGSILIEAFDADLGFNSIHAHAASTSIDSLATTRYSSVGTVSVFYTRSVFGSVN